MHVLVVACFRNSLLCRLKTNKAVLAGLKEDTQWSESLLEACHDDHKKGRGGMPLLINQVDLEQVSYRSSVALI